MEEPTQTPPSPPAPTRLVTRKFLHLLAVVALFGMSWSFYLILPKFMAQELGLDAAAIGRLVAVEGIAAVVATPFVGALVDRLGRRAWIVIGTTLLVGAGIGFTFVEDVGPLLYMLQILWGIAMVMTFNAAGTLTSDIAPSDRMAQAIGMFGAANLGMNAVSPALGEVLANRYGWDSVFIASALAAVGATLLGLLLKDPPKREDAELRDGYHVLSWPLLRVYIATFMFTAAFTALFTLHQPYALERGVTEVRNFFIGFAIMALTVRLGGGRAIDRVGVYEAAIASLVLYAVVPPVLGWVGPMHLGKVGLLMGLAHGVIYPAVTALGIARAGEANKGMVVSMVHGAFNAGHATFAFVLGLAAAQRSFEFAFAMAGAATLFGAFVLGFRGVYRPLAETQA